MKSRTAIIHLHERIHGSAEAAEITRTFDLFTAILTEATQRKGIEKSEIYHCRRALTGEKQADPNYTIRAWRSVVTYLLRQHEFLYE